MTKELSKQLCELCGIEAKFKLFGKGTYVHTESQIDDLPNELKDRAKNSWVEVYPDFGEPENFVKLIKIWLSLFEEYRCWRHNMSFPIEEQLINDALYRCSDEYPTNRLRQQIREAEWKYE